MCVNAYMYIYSVSQQQISRTLSISRVIELACWIFSHCHHWKHFLFKLTTYVLINQEPYWQRNRFPQVTVHFTQYEAFKDKNAVIHRLKIDLAEVSDISHCLTSGETHSIAGGVWRILNTEALQCFYFSFVQLKIHPPWPIHVHSKVQWNFNWFTGNVFYTCTITSSDSKYWGQSN